MVAPKRSLIRKGRTPTAPTPEQPKKKRKIIVLWLFDSGLPDLATNKKYMEDFGR